MTKKTGILAAVVGFGLLTGTAWAQDPTAATVVAKVNDTEITLGHMIALKEKLPAQYQSLPADVLFKGLLDQLIDQTTLQQSVGEPALRDKLTMENDNRGYLSNLALQKVATEAVTDAALQAAYDAKYTNAAPQKEYSTAHILVETEEKANELKAQLEGGADFAELAKANSTDTGSGAAGGELGWIKLGMTVQPFEDAVVAAEVGKIAGPVQSEYGFHLIRVNEVRDATAPTLEEVRPELASEIERAAIEAHLESLKAAATIERMGEGLDPALLSQSTLLDQ